MPHTKHSTYRIADTLRRLLRRNAGASLRKILGRIHPADVALELDEFAPAERIKLLGHSGDAKRQAEVVASLEGFKAAELVEKLSIERNVELLREMSGDDRADILGELDEELAQKILAAMPVEESDAVAELMRYDENTAGGIMSPDFLAMPSEITVEEAISIVRQSPEVEMAFYIYVVNVHGSLVGVVSLRQLVTSPPSGLLRDIMNPDVVSVQTMEDQEEVARLVARYDFLAVPVVDETHHLVGVVTVDDVIDVIREEATEDILKLAGAGEEFEEKPSVLRSAKSRAPWLAAACAGGIVASFVIGYFEETLQRSVVLVTFIPVIIGMAGNVGTQSLTTVVRGLATNRIDVDRFWWVIGRETLIGVMLGILYGAVLGAMGFIQTGANNPQTNAMIVGTVIGCAAAVSMVVAAAMATTMPMVFERLNIDPAIATGPFVTTAIDVIGVFVYFTIATAFV